jgi:hypothetical protein
MNDPVDVCWDIRSFSVSVPTICGIPPDSRLEDSLYLEGRATCHLDQSLSRFISILQQTQSWRQNFAFNCLPHMASWQY